jgi:sulfotransferase family protein
VTDATPAFVHLHDLGKPSFSPEIEQIRDLMAAMVPDCPLDADRLHAKAAAETGLDLVHVPRWRDYYLAHDQTSSYQHLAVQLKAMQFLRGGRRWLLKSPQHLEQLPVLDAVFPGVIVVCTHRDPVPVTLSMIAMLTYTARMHRSPVPVHEIAASWVDRLQLMLAALARDRDIIPPQRSIDVRFDDFMADELAVAERVYELAGEPLTDEARAAMADYLAGHQRGRLGQVATSAEMFGLDEPNLRARFTAYVQRFLA